MKVHYDQSGFTLLESLFQLLITIAFLHLIILFLLFKDATHHQLTDSSTIEWELFMIDLQSDLSEVKSINISNNGMMLTAHKSDPENKTEYTISGNEENSPKIGVIRRRLGDKGHVPFLTYVQAVKFVDEGALLNVSVTLVDGTERQRRIAVGLVE